MKTILSYITAPVESRFWNFFVLNTLCVLAGYASFKQSDCFGIAVLVFVFCLFLAGYEYRMLRRLCLEGAPDKFVVDGSVFPPLWTLGDFKQTGNVALNAFGFMLTTVLLLLVNIAAWGVIGLVSMFLLGFLGVGQNVGFYLTMVLWGFGAFAFILDGVAGVYYFVQTWDVWANWRIKRNFKTVARFWPTVLLLTVLLVVSFFGEYQWMFGALAGKTPLQIGVGLVVISILETYLITLLAVIQGRLYYRLRVKEQTFLTHD